MGANGATGEVSAVRLPQGETFREYVDRMLASVEGVDVRPFEADMLARLRRDPGSERIVLVSTPGGASWFRDRLERGGRDE